RSWRRGGWCEGRSAGPRLARRGRRRRGARRPPPPAPTAPAPAAAPPTPRAGPPGSRARGSGPRLLLLRARLDALVVESGITRLDARLAQDLVGVLLPLALAPGAPWRRRTG